MANLMAQKNVRREGTWVTLFQMPGNPEGQEEKLTIRSVCLLAEAIYTSWLGAFYHNVAHDNLLQLCPYDGTFWRGACTHSPLAENLRLPIDTELRKKRYREYLKNWVANLSGAALTRYQAYRKWTPMKQEERRAKQAAWTAEERSAHNSQVAESRKRKRDNWDEERQEDERNYMRTYQKNQKEQMNEEELKAFKAANAAKSKKYKEKKAKTMTEEEKEEKREKQREYMRAYKDRRRELRATNPEKTAAQQRRDQEAQNKKNAAMTAEERAEKNAKSRAKAAEKRAKTGK
ncbi:MAG: hypothetical protein M1819_003874 [Sarea resinae]|nr:MAG: hypothetical protein M1819_003874 [Sarea resinae]